MLVALACALALGRVSGQTPGAAVARGQLLSGQITYSGEVPLETTPDAAGVRRPVLSVDRRSGGLSEVVVWLSGDTDPHELAAWPAANDLPPVIVDQINETFVPRVVAARAGQTVEFRNSDGGNHNVRAASTVAGNQFNVFTPAGDKYLHRFLPHPKLRPVLIGCDIHPWMRAWVYVFEHPYFALTEETGRFKIADVPPGSYTLHIRQPDGPLSHDLPVHISDTPPAALTIPLTLPPRS